MPNGTEHSGILFGEATRSNNALPQLRVKITPEEFNRVWRTVLGEEDCLAEGSVVPAFFLL